MTLFGAVWLCILIVAFIKNNASMLVTMVLLSSTLQSSNVIVINGQGIGPQIITSGIFVIWFATTQLWSRKFRISTAFFTKEKFLMLLMIYIILNAVRTDTLISNLLRIIQLFIYIMCFFTMKNISVKLDDTYVYSTIKKISVFILAVGVVQVLCTTNIIPRYWFIRDIFWNDGNIQPGVVQFMWDGYYFRFFSTYMEPSYFVGFSVGALVFFFNNKLSRKKDYVLIAALAIATILSFSSTGYGALLILIIVYIAFSKDWKMKLFVLTGGLAGFLIFYFGFHDILDSVIFSKMHSGSANARLAWNAAALDRFMSSPIFGIGYKNCRASSMFYTILAELGIVGFIIYCLFVLSVIYPVFTRKWQLKAGTDQVGVCFAIIGVIASQMIAVPDFDICTFWMWMNLLGLTVGFNSPHPEANNYE